MNWPEIYLAMIQSGGETVSAKVRAVYEREVGFMKNPPKDFPYYFDPERGEHHIGFIEKFCRTSKGSKNAAKKLIRLEPFQKAKLQLVFGWVEKETNFRRFREVDDYRGRKCGKSTETSGTFGWYRYSADLPSEAAAGFQAAAGFGTDLQCQERWQW